MFPALPVGGQIFSLCHAMSGKARIYGNCIRSYTPGAKEDKHLCCPVAPRHLLPSLISRAATDDLGWLDAVL